jgi:hypothetical protein
MISGAERSASRRPKRWGADEVAFLVENYPIKGKAWCVENMRLKESQVRSKASSLGLVARGISEAWKEKQVQHAKKLLGRKRPEQADVIRRAIIDKGLHLHSAEVKAEAGKKLSAHIKKNGHPRGALGMKHSEETRKKISKKNIAWNKRITAEERAEIVMRGMKTRAENGTLVPNRQGTTWKAGWREIGGQRKYFRSKWEANYARFLQLLVANGKILSWEHEAVTFWFDGIKRGACSYLPDFRVTENDGSVVFHEVKGWMDARSKTKIRRMAKYHPSVKLIVIQAKEYKEISRKVGGLCVGWE